MDSWKEKIKLEDDELVTTYSSTVFKAEIPIRLMGTSDKIHPKQEQIISQLITKYSCWLPVPTYRLLNLVLNHLFRFLF